MARYNPLLDNILNAVELPPTQEIWRYIYCLSERIQGGPAGPLLRRVYDPIQHTYRFILQHLNTWLTVQCPATVPISPSVPIDVPFRVDGAIANGDVGQFTNMMVFVSPGFWTITPSPFSPTTIDAGELTQHGNCNGVTGPGEVVYTITVTMTSPAFIQATAQFRSVA